MPGIVRLSRIFSTIDRFNEQLDIGGAKVSSVTMVEDGMVDEGRERDRPSRLQKRPQMWIFHCAGGSISQPRVAEMVKGGRENSESC